MIKIHTLVALKLQQFACHFLFLQELLIMLTHTQLMKGFRLLHGLFALNAFHFFQLDFLSIGRFTVVIKSTDLATL